MARVQNTTSKALGHVTNNLQVIGHMLPWIRSLIAPGHVTGVQNITLSKALGHVTDNLQVIVHKLPIYCIMYNVYICKFSNI